MEPWKSERLAAVLVASQLRAGRSSSDPKSFWGRPVAIATVDVLLFLAAVFVANGIVGSTSAGALRSTVQGIVPFLPLAAAGAVLVAGTMFELTTNARFAGSDAANWLPITPSEYVLGSSAAIAFTYSPVVAILLGGILPFELAFGAGVTFGIAAVLTVVALFEGAFLVEMIRAVANRASRVGAGRHGSATFVLRAALLVGVILLLDLALNPVFLFDVASHLSALPALSFAVPFFWASGALDNWIAGRALAALALAVGQLAFVVLLGAAAAAVRSRYWVPSVGEVQLDAHRYAAGHPILARFGLSRQERAIAAKDLHGYIRRREMQPLLVVPIVLVLLLAIEGGNFGPFGSVLWVGWVAGFFALLLSLTSIGQERRAVQLLFAFPITAPTVFRAKCASLLLPVGVGALVISLGVGAFDRFALPSLLAVAALTVGVSAVLVLWGLSFAARYSDFQERPRPQFVRPTAMLAATVSGVVLLSAILVPGGYAIVDPAGLGAILGVVAAAIGVAAGAGAYVSARRGFDALFRELPF